MRFASLGSGSAGNSTLIQHGNTLVMVDCGFGIRDTERRLSSFDLSPERLSAIIVTHEHTDHLKGVGPLSRKYNIPVYMTEGTFFSREHGRLPDLRLIRHYEPFHIDQVEVIPVAVPHDAREPAQYIFHGNDLKLGILTDLGSITSHIIDHYRHCDGLLIEANHDLTMLARGPYPLSLQRRVASAWGHLNNAQAVAFLQEPGFERLKQVVVGHISQKNNSLEEVEKVMQPLAHKYSSMLFASQDEGFPWVDLCG